MMIKKFLSASIVILLGYCSFGQEMFRLADDERIVLSHGWKYIMDDNSVYARPLFNDSQWKPIKADLDIHDSLPDDAKNGVGWMRLRFHVAENLRGAHLALGIKQSVASEIYVNGALLQKFGVISNDPRKVKAFDPIFKPIVFPLSEDSIQVLAVRFAVQSGIHYTTIFESPNALLSMESSGHEKAVNSNKYIVVQEHSFEMLLIGILIMLVVVHLTFYLLVPEQKANLYFVLYGISCLIGAVLQLKYYLYSNIVASKFYLGNVAFIFFMIGNICILLATYHFLEKKTDKYFRFLLGFFFVSIILNAAIYEKGWKLGGPIFQLLTYVNIVRLCYGSFKEGKRGATALTIGSVATVVLFFTFILQGTFTNSSFLQSLTVVRMVNYLLYCLSFPVAVSFFWRKISHSPVKA